MTSQTIRTRFLVLSDTHGALLPENRKPKEPVDVVIHCGNLTQESKLKEFRTAIRLKSINAPLKLVIAGNHDFTLDTPTFRRKLEEFQSPTDKNLVELEYGALGEARKLLDEAAKEGITFLDEGTHHFTLANGAHLTVYASPYTPSINNWGFQYDPRQGHEWPIKKDVDIVMTHGPPLGIFDLQGSRRIGCPQLFEAVANAKPLMHCLGHVHNDWGARLVRWREKMPNPPSHLTSFEKKLSVTIETLKSLKTARFDTVEMIMEKYKRVKKYEVDGYCETRHSRGTKHPLEPGAQTLFVNAAILGTEDDPVHFPWVVELDLPKSKGPCYRGLLQG
ncbi:Metallophos domain-containing protein [Fusarium sp. LHS14.1]|nr:Metallophos domain-containing protein [Fusarium sp. LHS14.1]